MDKKDRKLMERYLENIEKHSQCSMPISRNIFLIRNILDEEVKKYNDRANSAWKSKKRGEKYLN